MLEIRGAFEAGASGAATIAARAKALDELCERAVGAGGRAATAGWRPALRWWRLAAMGGGQLFPYSDVDLLFLLDGRLAEKDVKDAIRRVNQEMWDCRDTRLSGDAEAGGVRALR